MDLFQGIRDSYLAEGLTDDQIKSLVDIAQEISYPADAEICREDEVGEDVYLLLVGKAKVQTGQGDLIARLQPGAIIGEIALFGQDRRSAAVVSDGVSTLARINADAFNDMINCHPEIGVIVLRNLGKTLCKRLRSSNVQLEAVLQVL